MTTYKFQRMNKPAFVIFIFNGKYFYIPPGRENSGVKLQNTSQPLKTVAVVLDPNDTFDETPILSIILHNKHARTPEGLSLTDQTQTTTAKALITLIFIIPRHL